MIAWVRSRSSGAIGAMAWVGSMGMSPAGVCAPAAAARTTAPITRVTKAPARAPFGEARIHLGHDERIVFLGDSITEQNLWTAYVEAFLVSRLPGSRLVFTNVGVGGNRVEDAIARFGRDVVPLQPTVVVVALGMNDGRYVAPDPEIRRAYVAGQAKLAELIAATGAREILITPSPVNPRHALYLRPYNETLAGLTQALADAAIARSIPLVDVFTPARAWLEESAQPQSLTNDGVHLTAVGAFILAHHVLERFAVPTGIPDVVVSPGSVRAAKPIEARPVRRGRGHMAFDLKLPFVPFAVPREARAALEMVPFSDRLNRARLRIVGWPGPRAVRVSVDGREQAVLAPGELAGGLDLAALETAPWLEQGRALAREARLRHARHVDAWRTLGVDGSAFAQGLVTYVPLIAAQQAYVRESGERLRELIQPHIHRIELEDTSEIPIRTLELSPAYPFDRTPESFERAHTPETAPEAVAWRPVSVQGRNVDLADALGHPSMTVVYARLTLQASAPCDLALSLGSNDGLTVIVNGVRVLARDVQRGLQLGDDQLIAPLNKGSNVILFRVTQVELKHGLAVKAEVRGNAVVVPVVARPAQSGAGG